MMVATIRAKALPADCFLPGSHPEILTCNPYLTVKRNIDLKKYLFLLFITILIRFQEVEAQQPVWQNISIDQGLPDPNVTAISKAADGKLYIGTAIGLYSYDGYTFRKVELSPHKKINPYINCLKTDGKALFVGARDALIRLDLSTYNTELVFHPLNSIGGAIDLYLNADKSKLFSFSHGGILILDITSNSLLTVDSVSEATILKLRIAEKDEIHAFCSNRKFITINNHVQTSLFDDKEILDACWWEQEHAWLIAKKDGLYLLDGGYKALTKMDLQVQINPVENRWLYPDQCGGFWIQVAGRFAYLKSATEMSLEFFGNEPGNPFSFTSNTAQAFFTEPNGTRWVGGDGTGLSYLRLTGHKIYYLTNEEAGVQHFWCFRYEKKSHTLLCGTSSGILQGTLANNRFENRKLFKPAGFDRFSVNAIADLNEQEYIISVYRAGFWTFNKQTGHFKQLTVINNEIGSLFIFGIREVSENRLVLCTQNSASVLDKKTMKLSGFIQPVHHNYSIYTAIEDSRKQFLVAGGFGLQVFNPQLEQVGYFSKKEDTSTSLPSNVIFDLKETGSGKYLVATMGAGLCMYRADDQTFHPVKLATNPDNIFGMMQNGAGAFFLTTSNGLCRYDLQTGESVVLNKTNFLPFNDFNQSAFYQDADYTIAGGEKGMLLINTKDIDSIFNLSSKILVRNEAKSIESLVVEPGEHSIHLEVSLSDILPLAKRKFRYRIYGLDDDWQTLPAGQNTLTYNYLPPGKYLLELEMDDETGLIRVPKRTIRVDVKPYFYETLWFRILAFIGIIGAVFAFVRYFALLRLRWRLNRLDAERKIMLERSRISRELHDNLGSQLTYMISGLETTDLLLKRNKIDKTAHNLEKLQLAARESMQQLRDSIWALTPGAMTLNSLAGQFEKWSKKVADPFEQLHYSFSRNDFRDHDIDPIAGLNIFRIMQEAVHNALKHSGATDLTASMICNEAGLTITITDNGKGINAGNEEGTGLSSMNQRAEAIKATLTFESVPGGGTRVVLNLDINTLKG